MKLSHTKHKDIVEKIEYFKSEGFPLIYREQELLDFIDAMLPEADHDLKEQLVEYFVEGKGVDWDAYTATLLNEVSLRL
ncbi:hypothetical protein ACU5DF_02875 [Aliivibrio wodanis]|uniref:hypothetical protein n=1 Tax=Aliivibrio wodanis TaxID=80852 RepID=UPI00406BE4EC